MHPAPIPYPHDLSDGTVVLRPHRMIDAPALAEAVRESVDTVGRWQDWCHAGYGDADAAAWIGICRQHWLTGEGNEFLVFDAQSDRLLGGMGVNHLNYEHRFANLGYWVRQSAQGKGIATRAGALAARFALEVMQVSRLEIVAAHDNQPSRRTAERIGGVFEGILRNRLVLKGMAVDAAMYALVPDQPAAAHIRSIST
jgi:RimJ/RimL family protein N-acetyltransferase